MAGDTPIYRLRAKATTAAKRTQDQPDDSILLTQLRGGSIEAYEALWRRHVSAALRVARIIAPNRTEDLVADSFLAVYQQVAIKGNGPESAFRAYLFTTMRNTAIQWSKADRREVTLEEFEGAVEEDGWSILETQTTSTQLLDAFQALPDRWQRALWLAEIEQAPRPKIAADLGIKPNAVSALLRRARIGLRAQWLIHTIPNSLRVDPLHVASQVLAEVTGEKLTISKEQYRAHLRSCETCEELRSDLREQSQRMRRTTLAGAGFAALGVALPAATPASLTALGVGSGALFAGSVGTSMLAASITLLIAGGSITAGVMIGAFERSDAPQHSDKVESNSQADEETDTSTSKNQDHTYQNSETTELDTQATLGRGNTSTTIPQVDFTRNEQPNDFYAPPSRPTPAIPDSVPPPAPHNNNNDLHTGIANPALSTGFLAPKLSGTSAPFALIAIELERPADTSREATTVEQFTVSSDFAGNWLFDPRTIATNVAGTYLYRVWATLGSEVSAADSGKFEILPLTILGFENLAPFEAIPLGEASTSGIVFEVRGRPNGTVCLSSIYAGQALEISLDASGLAVKRMRLHTGGTYLLNFRSCEGEYRGPATELFIDVEDPSGPIFGPFGPDPAHTRVELSDL